MKIYNWSQFIKENKNLKKILILTGEGFQDDEVFKPKERLESEDFEVIVSSNEAKNYKAFNSEKNIEVRKPLTSLNPNDFDMLIIPGGKAPEYLREEKSVINFVRDFYKTGKPIASICHGPLILVSAKLVEGKKMTCFEDVVEELKSAGAIYKNRSCVKDDQFITSRNPGDLEDFCDAVIEKLKS
jgi:protease I